MGQFKFGLLWQQCRVSEVSGDFCRKLYGEKESADVKIACDDKQFDCHKVVLSSQREVSGARKYVAWAWGGVFAW